MSDLVRHIAHCSSCGCKMDISAMAPYTNVVCPDCGHHTRVKCELGHYLLTSRHAVGGMSIVFVARDTTLERDVAIKLLNEEYSGDAKRMEEFEHEAKVTAALSHPHIVRVFTVGKEFGQYFIAMEMVPGENLEQKISAGGAIGEDEMLPIALEIISGLRAAKTAGVIHRDMKPGNILFDEAGHVKIVDFGLALLTKGGTAKAEEIWATPYYVPPEALDGEEEDFRSDIYALGATLYHALSGKPPLPLDVKSTREVRKAKEHIAPLADAAPWLNSATCHLVDKAMAFKPSDRFVSYAEMEEAWNAAFQMMRGGGADEPIHSEDRLRRRVKDKKGILGLAVAGVLLFAFVAIVASIFLDENGSDAVSESATLSDADALTDAGVGQSDLTEGDGGYNPEMAARIGRLFRSSHQLLKRKKYPEARNQFIALTQDPDIKEPLPTWAHVEALIAAWLSGNSQSYSDSVRSFTQHLKSPSNQQSAKMLELGQLLSSLEVIRVPGVGDEPMAVVQWMAMALKNWEMGSMDEAVPFFEKVIKHPLPTGSPLLVYRAIAQDYLNDYLKLKTLFDRASASDIEAVKSQLSELKSVLGSIQTNGRARFHIRALQLRLHHQMKTSQSLDERRALADSLAVKVSNYDEQLAEYKGMIKGARFAEASAQLQQATSLDAEQKSERDAWVYLADCSNVFLGQLEEAIPKGGMKMQIKGISDDGYEVAYMRVLGSKPGGLLLMGNDGEVFIPWGKVEPSSVIDVFKQALNPSLSTTQGQMHTETAISYAWLSGMEDKATMAAAKLSEVNRGFGQRWKKTMKEIDLNP